MPRKPRIEYAGAVYHVLNRGNYQEDVFCVLDSGRLFERTLVECCERFGWRLHAYVIMSNHYHLAIETAEPNLCAGMQWLQSTFGNRFNRIVNKRGHVFQGRYKALLIEDNGYLLQVVNYVHLNPVRAGISPLDELRDYQLGSFPKFFSKKRPHCLVNKTWLNLAGNLKPTAAGMRRYHKYLGLFVETDPLKQKQLHRDLCRGWFIGTQSGKKAIMEDVSKGLLGLDSDSGLNRFGVEGAEVLLSHGLACLGKTETDLSVDRKGAPWKVALATWIKLRCGVNNQWISDHLHMGNIFNISRMISTEQKRPKKRDQVWKKLNSAKYKA